MVLIPVILLLVIHINIFRNRKTISLSDSTHQPSNKRCLAQSIITNYGLWTSLAQDDNLLIRCDKHGKHYSPYVEQIRCRYTLYKRASQEKREVFLPLQSQEKKSRNDAGVEK